MDLRPGPTIVYVFGVLLLVAGAAGYTLHRRGEEGPAVVREVGRETSRA